MLKAWTRYRADKTDEKRSLERELEAIFGNLLSVVIVAGADLLLIAMLYRQLEFLDPQNRGNEFYEKTEEPATLCENGPHLLGEEQLC